MAASKPLLEHSKAEGRQCRDPPAQSLGCFARRCALGGSGPLGSRAKVCPARQPSAGGPSVAPRSVRGRGHSRHRSQSAPLAHTRISGCSWWSDFDTRGPPRRLGSCAPVAGTREPQDKLCSPGQEKRRDCITEHPVCQEILDRFTPVFLGRSASTMHVISPGIVRSGGEGDGLAGPAGDSPSPGDGNGDDGGAPHGWLFSARSTSAALRRASALVGSMARTRRYSRRARS